MKRLLELLCEAVLLQHVISVREFSQGVETFVSVSRLLCYGTPGWKFCSSDTID